MQWTLVFQAPQLSLLEAGRYPQEARSVVSWNPWGWKDHSGIVCDRRLPTRSGGANCLLLLQTRRSSTNNFNAHSQIDIEAAHQAERSVAVMVLRPIFE